ncbi:leucine-rich repeat-containing protein 56 [Cheilinus undulatus]|uniref:leucine-rich repeat-containing protein 56 n=1 Tax=Cheilinus undulatus TaxID=241271 RepID=UPI001BD42EDD|nr:leucine-rich repeat-containing protein 56 [Cheilinus undulatus]
MSCCLRSVPQEVRPGTARIQVTELSGSGSINPTPATKPCEHSETAVEVYLTPEKLEWLCGTQDLSNVTSLEICIDTQEIILGNFGAYLPKLVQLKMNNSVIMSVRDLGTTLSHLQVLWMFRCSLQDFDGISTFSALKELYAAYNNVSDLSPVGMLENLQLLDLEGNSVDDLVQIQYLGLCGKLERLTLEGNPLCVRPNPTAIQTADYSYRSVVRELIPQLRYLDNIRVEEEGRSCCGTMGEEWSILRNSIRDFNSPQAADDGATAGSAGSHRRPGSAGHPASSLSCVCPRSLASSRPLSGYRPMSANKLGVLSPPGSRPSSADSDLATVEAETSNLTHGAGKILFCGNPVQAIRARREKLRTAPAKSTFTPCNLPIHVPEHTYDLEEPDVVERDDVFAMLRTWREQHNRRLQAIETERRPQVLAIHHSDEEEGEDDDEGEGFGGEWSDSSDQRHEEKTHSGDTNNVSPDSSFQSLSPDLQHRESVSPNMARLSLSLNTTLFPSPPLCATAAICNRKPQGIRARRLRLSQTNIGNISHLNRGGGSPGTHLTTGDTDLTPEGFQQETRIDVQLMPSSAHKPQPPQMTALREGITERDWCGEQTGNKHHQTFQKSRLVDRPAMTRPHTARAALQKHLQHHTLQTCRGSSQPD